jgi:hypothetical protein
MNTYYVIISRDKAQFCVKSHSIYEVEEWIRENLTRRGYYVRLEDRKEPGAICCSS